jgi:hypothetical protein
VVALVESRVAAKVVTARLGMQEVSATVEKVEPESQTMKAERSQTEAMPVLTTPMLPKVAAQTPGEKV